MDVATLRLLQVGITLAAIGASVIVALRIGDSLASLTIAIAASLVVLPVTWFHYPVALIPVGVALACRSPSSRPIIALAVLLADLAIAFGSLLWVAVVLLIVAAFRAGPGTSPGSTPVPVTGRTTPP